MYNIQSGGNIGLLCRCVWFYLRIDVNNEISTLSNNKNQIYLYIKYFYSSRFQGTFRPLKFKLIHLCAIFDRTGHIS